MLTLSKVDSQPARPAPVSVAGEPVTYVPPFTVTCPLSTQPPIFVAQPKTIQAATIKHNLEGTVQLQASISNPLNPVCSENASMSQTAVVMPVYGTAQSDQGSRLLGAVAPQDVISSTSPSSTTVTFQMSSSQTVSSLVVTRAESVFTSPSSRGPVTSLPEVSPKHKAYSDSDPHMQVDSMNTSLTSRGIISCDLLPPPTPSEEDLVKASVAGLHYATTLQAQSISNVQERIIQGPQTMSPFLPLPHYTMATTPPNTTTVALQMSTPAQTTSTSDGSSLQSAAVAHASSELPLSDSDQSVAVSESLTQASTTDEGSLTSINPSEAGEAFREHRDDLLIAITEPDILANSLYSKKIISKETLDEMMLVSLTNGKKNIILLNAVEARIRTNPSDFLTVLAVLSRYPHLCVFAEGLRNSYCELA